MHILQLQLQTTGAQLNHATYSVPG